jgi:tetratricopeptide (TPR) repeat protein
MLALVSFAVLFAPAVITGGDLDTAFQQLKDATAGKDVAQVKALAAQTCALAREVISAPAPTDADEKENWKTHVAFAHDVEVYTEYALYATAVGAPPETTVDLLATLQQQNPKSKYLADAYGLYFHALRQTGAAAKIPAIAEKAIENLPENDDLLAYLAEAAIGKKQNDRALGYAKRLTAALGKRSKPEGMPAAEWERKRGTELASGYWISGVVQAEKGGYFEADKELRAALPLVAGNEGRKAAALFYLGLANYNLGKMTMKKSQVLEAAQFSKDAAGIQGPLAQQAWHNAQVMRDEAAKMR